MALDFAKEAIYTSKDAQDIIDEVYSESEINWVNLIFKVDKEIKLDVEKFLDKREKEVKYERNERY